jgi:hypothetical protein
MNDSIRLSAFLLCLVALLSITLMTPKTAKAMFSITIYFGQRPSCSGRGFCKIEIGLERIAGGREGEDTKRAARTGQASASVEQDKTAREANHRFLKIELRSALPDTGSTIPVSENMTLDAAASKALGFKSVTVLKGDYKVDYSRNKLGTINLKVETHD